MAGTLERFNYFCCANVSSHPVRIASKKDSIVTLCARGNEHRPWNAACVRRNGGVTMLIAHNNCVAFNDAVVVFYSTREGLGEAAVL